VRERIDDERVIDAAVAQHRVDIGQCGGLDIDHLARVGRCAAVCSASSAR
jgi:hypothetical protein